MSFSVYLLEHVSALQGHHQQPSSDQNKSQQITVVARSKAWTFFALSNTGIVGSNPTRDMDVCVHLFCV
jgi:hypothetical protein